MTDHCLSNKSGCEILAFVGASTPRKAADYNPGIERVKMNNMSHSIIKDGNMYIAEHRAVMCYY